MKQKIDRDEFLEFRISKKKRLSVENLKQKIDRDEFLEFKIPKK